MFAHTHTCKSNEQGRGWSHACLKSSQMMFPKKTKATISVVLRLDFLQNSSVGSTAQCCSMECLQGRSQPGSAADLGHGHHPTMGIVQFLHLEPSELLVQLPCHGAHFSTTILASLFSCRDLADRSDHCGGACAEALVGAESEVDRNALLLHLVAEVLGQLNHAQSGDSWEDGADRDVRGVDHIVLHAEEVGRTHLFDVLVLLRIQVDDLGETFLLSSTGHHYAGSVVADCLHTALPARRGAVVVLGNQEGDWAQATLEVGAHRANIDAECVLRGRSHSQNGARTPKAGSDIERAFAVRRHPSQVGIHHCFHGLNEEIRARLGHREPLCAELHSLRVLLGAEEHNLA
mmetsp:Transcript_12878/g.28545  ORF Transcript_12878/g.28545 Transcript_12878/m.28545 type:complete len:347 (-) Transcript_12878:324-1364(-)